MTDVNDPGRSGREGVPVAAGESGAAAQPKRGLGTGAILGIVGGGLAVIVAIAVVVALAIVPKGSGAADADAAIVVEQSSDPADVARQFMSALAKSDAKTALRYVDNVTSTEYLTNKILAGSNKVAPLTKVTVGKVLKPNDYDVKIPVSYRIGDRSLSTTLNLFKSSSKGWRVQNSTVSLYVDPFVPLGLTLNGVAITGKSVRVFPGAYEMKLTNENFAIEGESTIVAEFGETPSMYETKPTLSEAGLATFRDLIKKDVDACLASASIDPGCGIRPARQSSDGTTLVDGSLSRTLDASGLAKLSTLEARPSVSNPLLVEAGLIGGSIETTGQCLKDGRQFPCQLMFGGTGLGKPTVDFSAETPVLRW